MNLAAAPSGASSIESQRDEWFGRLFHALNTDKILLATQTASEEKTAFYDALMHPDPLMGVAEAKKVFNQQITEKALVAFISHVFASTSKPRKLAFNIADSSLLVWAVVADDDFEAEKTVYLAQAALNAQFASVYYRVSATVVEESDRLDTPEHYRMLKIPRQLIEQQ